MGDAPQSLERRDALVLGGASGEGAGPDRLPIHEYGASSALAQAAAKPGAVQSQVIA